MSVTEPTYPFLPDGATVWSITQLNAKVKAKIEKDFADVWVEGEITDFKIPASGHAYFTLKDEGSTLRAVLYRGQLSKLGAGVEPKNGLEVLAYGHLSIYLPRGEYQLQVQRLHPKGLGAAEQALRELREKLTRLGYFDPRRKRPLPRFPRWIGLIASATGAAVHDMIEILGRRWPVARVFVRPARVQGEGSAEEVAAAIRQINRWKESNLCPTDVIILGRGGGSADDLGAFNQEIVADAIYRSKIPIVSAVGHEVDVTIADMVADVRAATPSHAAELVAPDQAELLAQLAGCAARIATTQTQRLRLLRRRLGDLAQRRVLLAPLEPIRVRERVLDDWGERLSRSLQLRMVRQRQRLDAMTAQLESLSPLNVLARGFSLTTSASARNLLRSVDQVQLGERIVTRLHHGQLTSRVESKESPPDCPTEDSRRG